MSYILEIEYKDGFVFSDPDFVVVNHQASSDHDHGPVVRWSAIGEKEKYSIDFSKLPDNVRPIHYVNRTWKINIDTKEEWRHDAHCFGYQYNDPSGKNHRVVKELP